MQVVQTLEAVQDLITGSLCVGLFCAMALQMKSIVSLLFTTLECLGGTADMFFILILVDLRCPHLRRGQPRSPGLGPDAACSGVSWRVGSGWAWRIGDSNP